MAKRPPSAPEENDEAVNATIRMDVPDEDEEQQILASIKGAPPGGGGSVEVSDQGENDGSTAFVRLDATAAPQQQRQRPPRLGEKPPPQGAPKKGLQVQLPDDEPAPPPPPRVIVAPKADDNKKGRRGAWWDEQSGKLPDDEEPAPAPPDDAPVRDGSTAMFKPEPEETAPDAPEHAEHDGATAFVRKADLGQRKKPVPQPAEPEVEAYRPQPADDYQGHLSSGPPAWKLWVRRAVVVSLALSLLGVLALVGGYIYLSREIPTFDSVRDYHPFVSTKVVTADGTVVGQFFRERRTVVKMDQVPRILVQAVISAEDKDFYKHPGVNVVAAMRAVVVDALSGRKRLGASTITQQVVKNSFLSSEKKWKRKLKEILLAFRLERNLSKDDILYLYLNQINFGKAHYGVEEAALYYFNKHVQDIDLGEAAILAGLPQNPARINPRRHPDRAKTRQKYVLDRMLANHYISQEDHDREVEKPIALPLAPPEPPGAWYLEEVRRQLLAQFGDAAVETSGMTVEVAMDPKLQDAAEVAVQEGLRAVDKRQGWRGAEFKLDAEGIAGLRAAVAHKLAQVAQGGDSAQIVDLEAIGEKDRTSPEVIARAARATTLEQGGIYAGVVTSVGRADARVELGPDVEGTVPFSTMGWAREFKPEHATPAPRAPSDVLAVGDVVPVRVTHVQNGRDAARRARASRLELSLEQTPLVQGAFVAIDLRTRGVLALVGGYDAASSGAGSTAGSGFNRATQAKRQPGSAFKPFLYAAALESGKYSPVTRVDDSPEVITDPWTGKPWKPQNFEKDQFDGPISLRRALAMSKNTVAVKLLLELGIDKVRHQAVAAGLTSEIPQSYTAALGTGEVGVLELSNAYATLATQGRKAEPVFIKKVLGRDGNTLQTAPAELQQSMKPETAYLTADLMRSVIDDPDGTAHSLTALGRPAAGKTGTASEHRDGWFIGFTPSVLAGAWVGFDDHKMMGSLETGGHCAGPIWLSWMRAATANIAPEEFPAPPPGVTTEKVNRNTGGPTSDNDPYGVTEHFMAGTEPTTAAEGEQPSPTQEDYYQEPENR